MRILTFLIFILVNLESRAVAVTCDDLVASPIESLEELAHNSNFDLDSISSFCKIDLRKSLDPELLKQVETIVSRYRLEYHVSQLEAQSVYGPVNKEDLELARKYSKIFHGARSRQIEEYYIAGQAKPAIPENCSSVDLSSKMGPVRDQGYIAWCHAYTAADLLSFKTGKKISATSLAVHSESNVFPSVKLLFKTESERLHSGGYLNGTLASGLRQGLCLEEDFPSKYIPDKNLRSSLRNFIEESETKANLINEIRQFNLPMTLNSIGIKNCNEEAPQILLAMKQIQTLTKIRDAVISNSTARNVFAKMEEKACKKKRIFPTASIVTIDYGRPKNEMIAAIDDQLNRNAPPALVTLLGFCSIK